MGLSEDQLGMNEHIVLEMHEHWKHLLGTGLVCLAALAGLLVVLLVSPDTGWLSWLDAAGWVAFAVVFLVFGVWPFLKWLFRTYTITDERLATREGVIRRKGRDIPLDRINDVAFDQGLLDRMTRAGTLKISSASEEGTIEFKDIPHIHDVTKTINRLSRETRG